MTWKIFLQLDYVGWWHAKFHWPGSKLKTKWNILHASYWKIPWIRVRHSCASKFLDLKISINFTYQLLESYFIGWECVFFLFYFPVFFYKFPFLVAPLCTIFTINLNTLLTNYFSTAAKSKIYNLKIRMNFTTRYPILSPTTGLQPLWQPRQGLQPLCQPRQGLQPLWQPRQGHCQPQMTPYSPLLRPPSTQRYRKWSTTWKR